MAGVADQFKKHEFTSKELENALIRLVDRGEKKPSGSWDEAAQSYLAVVALLEAWGRQKNVHARPPVLQPTLMQLRGLLRFQDGVDSPRRRIHACGVAEALRRVEETIREVKMTSDSRARGASKCLVQACSWPGLNAVLICCATFLMVVAAYVGAPRSAAAVSAVDASDALQKPGAAERIKTFYGVGDCRGCHDNATFGDPKTSTSRYTEIPIWEKEDKHALAHKVLSDQRGSDMGRLLGYDVTKAAECLACHSVSAKETADTKFAASFAHDEGVSCVSCHGPEIFERSGQALEPSWVLRHSAKGFFRDEWRKLDRDFKHTKYGMADLWDPVKRTQLCASCHIGNAEQGKVVTHEMYAAGHPPLPGFEIVTFSRQMPGHWQYLREKTPKVQELLKVSKREADLEETNLLAIGALVSCQEYLKLLAAPVSKGQFPELANYDCYACHHDLTSESWRQQRGYAGVPGRPTLREWPLALVELGLVHAAQDTAEADKFVAEFHGHVNALQSVLDKTPFGNQSDLADKSRALTNFLEDRITTIQGRITKAEKPGGYDLSAPNELLKCALDLLERSRPGDKKAGKPKLRAPDYDSARQLAWAWQALHLETASKNNATTRSSLLEKLKSTEDWKKLDGRIHMSLLPLGKEKIESKLPERMSVLRQFAPQAYYGVLDPLIKKGQ